MQKWAIGALLVACAVTMLGAFSVARSHEPRAGLRVGVYDNRAIAVAYATSRFNPVSEKMAEFEKAKAAGDAKRVEELEAWGEKHQRQLHRQGFGRVPVDDLLAHVKDELPEVARKTGIDAIAWHCDYASADVEQVDITTELVMLFDPSKKTLKTVQELRKHEPVDLDVLEQGHDH
ncbi:MAG: hypothetical protein ACYS0G_06320 [Planctomycetota bacterium]|jgi:hypothetical protein